MLLLNFSHPITEEQRAQIEALSGQEIVEERATPLQLNNAQPFADQVSASVDSIGLSSEAWQTRPILVNPPGYSFAALTLLAELHGRMGYFPAIVRIRPISDATPPRYEVAEIINLQAVRDAARKSRTDHEEGEQR